MRIAHWEMMRPGDDDSQPMMMQRARVRNFLEDVYGSLF